MSDAAANYDPHRFRTTVPFYARYRLGYPESLIARVASEAVLKRDDAVLDLGCGPGTLSVPFARLGMAVLAVDPEPDMLAAAAGAAREAAVSVELRRGSSFDLPPDAGPFRLVTMGRSFHWMDRGATLEALDRLVVAGGAIALFDDEHPRTVENAWRRTLEEVGRRYGRSEEPHILERKSGTYRTHESHLLDSAFNDLVRVGAIVRRTLTIDEVVGLAYSLSTSAPQKLGERRSAFETDLRAALAALSPDGRFTEIAEMGALIARRG
jgi:ubiquinone/menaquinone biosynthesis C-methylase UbiE